MLGTPRNAESTLQRMPRLTRESNFMNIRYQVWAVPDRGMETPSGVRPRRRGRNGNVRCLAGRARRASQVGASPHDRQNES